MDDSREQQVTHIASALFKTLRKYPKLPPSIVFDSVLLFSRAVLSEIERLAEYAENPEIANQAREDFAKLLMLRRHPATEVCKNPTAPCAECEEPCPLR